MSFSQSHRARWRPGVPGGLHAFAEILRVKLSEGQVVRLVLERRWTPAEEI